MFDLGRRMVISEDCWTEPVFVGNLRGTGKPGLKAQHMARSYGEIVVQESGAHRMFGPSVSAASHKMQVSCQFSSPGATAKHPEKAVLRSHQTHTSKDRSHIETWITSSCNDG